MEKPYQNNSSLSTPLKKPPVNNMGAQTQAPILAPKENQILVDWFSWTLKTLNPDEAIKLSGLKYLPWGNDAKGGMGYKSSRRAGNIVCYFDGSDTMGCHISMTGQGCRQFEAYKNDKRCFYQLHKLLDEIGANITRFDIAIDNVDGALDINLLHDACKAKEVRSRFKGGHAIEGFSFESEAVNKGKSVYVGSNSSRMKVRFYDKAAEQKTTDGKHWVRCELQLMSERAQEASKHILNSVSVGELGVSILNNYFTVINKDASRNENCSTAAWWGAWLTTTNKIRLTVQKATKLISQVMAFMSNQYAPTLAMLTEAMGELPFRRWVVQIAEDGAKRMNLKHEQILFNSRMEFFGGDPLPF